MGVDAVERCEVCGFAWDQVRPEEVPSRLAAAAAGFAEVLGAAEDHQVSVRPRPDTWSALEYAGHVRDVLTNLRDRIVLGLVLDHPQPHSMHGEARVDLGLYAADTPDVVAAEISLGAGLLGRTVAALSADQLERALVYLYPRVASRSLAWVAAQALHEAEHHLADARAASGH